MHKLFFSALLLISCGFLSAEEKFELRSIPYEVDGVKYECKTYYASHKQNSSRMHEQILNLVSEKIFALNGVPKVTPEQETQINVVVYNEMTGKEEFAKMAKGMSGYFTRQAEGIVMLHEQKLDPLEVGKKLFPDTNDQTMMSWMNASCTYTYEWAKKFLTYDEKEKIGTLFAPKKIQMAKFIIWAEKLSARYPAKEDALRQINAQLEELNIVVPEEYKAVKPNIGTALRNVYKMLNTPDWPEEMKQIVKIIQTPSPAEQIN